jgi:hypothetical protein
LKPECRILIVANAHQKVPCPQAIKPMKIEAYPTGFAASIVKKAP